MLVSIPRFRSALPFWKISFIRSSNYSVRNVSCPGTLVTQFQSQLLHQKFPKLSISISCQTFHSQSSQVDTKETFSTVSKLDLPEDFHESLKKWTINSNSYLHQVLPASAVTKMEDYLATTAMMFASSAAIGLGIGTVLSRFNLPYIMGHKVETTSTHHGGEIVADVLQKHGVKHIFTLVGGHISPILVAAEKLGIRVVDTRHEVTAVFAADAVARMSGTVGVAAVTAGPGLTNTVTAVKNAQMAESPLLLMGGAAASILQGRGALQDIDQMALFKPICKYVASIKSVREIAPAMRKALHEAQSGTPGE